jgi:hypothetical protein
MRFLIELVAYNEEDGSTVTDAELVRKHIADQFEPGVISELVIREDGGERYIPISFDEDVNVTPHEACIPVEEIPEAG